MPTRLDVTFAAVENRVRDAVLTAMDNVVFLRVEMTERSVSGSSRLDLSSVVQNPDQRDFSGNTENTTVMSAASLVDLNIDQDGNDETHNIEN